MKTLQLKESALSNAEETSIGNTAEYNYTTNQIRRGKINLQQGACT